MINGREYINLGDFATWEVNSWHMLRYCRWVVYYIYIYYFYYDLYITMGYYCYQLCWALMLGQHIPWKNLKTFPEPSGWQIKVHLQKNISYMKGLEYLPDKILSKHLSSPKKKVSQTSRCFVRFCVESFRQTHSPNSCKITGTLLLGAQPPPKCSFARPLP